MKIVLLGTAYPYRGGLANFNEQLAAECHAQGDDVRIYNFSLQYPDFLFPGTSQFSDGRNPLSTEIPNDRKVNSVNPFNWVNVGLELYRLKPELLIFRYWLPFMAPAYTVIAWIAKRNGHTQTVSIVDNAIPHEPRFYDIPVTKLFFKVCDRFLAMSEKVIRDFGKLSTKKIDFHAHPMYENYGEAIPKRDARSFFNINEDERVILFFGFIREYKGLDWLIEAFANEVVQTQHVRLIIAGEFYTERERYFELAKKLEVFDRIIWKNDFIPDREVATYFCAADAVILPYKHATQSGITQIAYYYQTPIIATRVGGLEEIIPHDKVGLIVEPNSVAIAKGIERFYAENLFSLFSENMVAEREKFTWTSFVDKIKTLIN